MEPIPETVEALRELTRSGDESIARTMLRLGGEVERIIPEIVGISVSVDGDMTFTMAATNGAVAELDGVQYLAGGPCEDTLHTGKSHTYSKGDTVDEDRWQMFARATAAAGVGSTLSLPILSDDTVVAGINMYASTPSAFDGNHEALATACGAWVGGAVTNADMDFSTRFQAAETTDRLRDRFVVAQAVGVLISDSGISVDDAEEKLRTAARRAGIADAQMARAILDLLTPSSTEEREDND